MKIVFVTQQYNENATVLKGGDVCTKSLYEALLYVFGNENIEVVSVPQEKNVIKIYYEYIHFRNMYTKAQEQDLVEKINNINYDYLFFDGTWFGRISEKINKKGRIITFMHNVEKDYSLQRFKKNILTLPKLCSVIYNENVIIKSSDYVIALNKRDDLLLNKYYKRDVDLFLPITFKDDYHVLNAQKIRTNTVLFVGSYFKPNVEGILWYIKNVQPYVKCNLLIVGKGMEKLKKYENEKIEVLGTVEDLAEVYNSVNAVVMPIMSGGGMKVKTAEALMYGKTIIATEEALMGYDYAKDEKIVMCNSAKDFISALNNLDITTFFEQKIRDIFLNYYEQKTKEVALDNFFKSIEEN